MKKRQVKPLKKLIALFFVSVFIFTLSACADAEPPKQENIFIPSSKILIAYFSVPEETDGAVTDSVSGASIVVKDCEKFGTTEYAAKKIAEVVDGDLFRIETEESYPTDHNSLVKQVREENAAEKRPSLSCRIDNFDYYETVFLCFPIWFDEMPSPIYSFLEEYDFGGKTVIPVTTNAASGFANTLNTIKTLQPEADLIGKPLSLPCEEVPNSDKRIFLWVKGLGLEGSEKIEMETVFSTAADPKNRQTLYLWEEGNMPTETEYLKNTGEYADDPDFRPNIETFPVPDGIPIKGAVLLNAGGSFEYRNNEWDCYPTAEELSKLGYQCFVVNYRLLPYTLREGSADIERAVRFVRQNAEIYGIEEKDIALLGFSAGGMLAGEVILNSDEAVSGKIIDTNYIPDSLDLISSDVAAAGMIYSYYMEFGEYYAEIPQDKASEIPPTYFCYGSKDYLIEMIEQCVGALEKADIPTEVNVLPHKQHGFGASEKWIEDFSEWLDNIFINN